MTTTARWIRRSVPILPLLVATGAGCATTQSVGFFPNENSSLLHGPKDPSRILVVPSGAPTRPYAIVGSMDLSLNPLTAGSLYSNLAWFTDRFREKAAQAGADGIMNLNIVRTGTAQSETNLGHTAMIGTSNEIYEMTADAFVLLPP